VEQGNRGEPEGSRENFQKWEIGYHVYILRERWNRVADGIGQGGGGIQCPSGVLGSEGEARDYKHRQADLERRGNQLFRIYLCP